LSAAGIEIIQGFDPKNIPSTADTVLIGNALSRGNAAVESVLNRNMTYSSGPQWLAENVLSTRHVLAVAGTHGKTTTSSLLAWILQERGLNPGFLIGGVPKNFSRTAQLGSGDYFVIEADEYDSAFFDKRSKFMHYRPRTLIMNNLEYDHADIFPDLAAIQKQFEYLLRTVPVEGTVIYPKSDTALNEVVTRGCWATQQAIGIEQGAWQTRSLADDGSQFEILHHDQTLAEVNWSQLGQHNIHNALAAVVAAQDIGVSVEQSVKALATFQGVKRRMEIRGIVNGITVYDDFAHHPTAIASTLAGLRAKVGDDRIIAVLEFGSNTMQDGIHRDLIPSSFQKANEVILLKPKNWNCTSLLPQFNQQATVYNSVPEIIQQLTSTLKPTDHVLVMSNKGFDNIHERLLKELTQ